ncbi:DUF1697 domain-containing protein [Microbacterium telephonicum]|uniref:Uncharacterized protein (DUF1697 family) n=1 Tax=Microbacterium telephonicum TaxID=1714841 RepID=A0A498CA29_9MICO|nr:DUF1697 domain-containing protein [Microbacterium telephonicum]RLK52363.1 uncharacterized protein (DUF1697 family) [Microbacterium telephonicum]
MATYLAFLRAINLGAKRVFPKGDIRRVAEELGFEDVDTHINTGNVRLSTRMRSRARIEAALEQGFARDRGFEVPTIAYSQREFAALAEEATAVTRPGLARHYVYLMKDELTPAQARAVESTSGDKGEMVVRGRVAHALLAPGYQDGDVDPLRAAKLLGTTTSRTLTVISTLAAKWC